MLSSDDIDFLVLQAVAWQSERSAVSRAVVREAVDIHKRIALSNAELDGALDRLQSAGRVIASEAGYAVAPTFAAALPRTKSGAISTAVAPWQRLRARLATTAAHDTYRGVAADVGAGDSPRLRLGSMVFLRS